MELGKLSGYKNADLWSAFLLVAKLVTLIWFA